MRKQTLCCIVLALLAVGVPIAVAEVPTPDESTLLQIEREACDAYLHGDADALDKLFTDDFTAINGRAEINTKAEEIAEVRQGSVHFTTFENTDMKVHQHGDTAVIIGITTLKGSAGGDKPFAIEVRFTDVFTRIDGRWRMLAGHSSRLPEQKN